MNNKCTLIIPTHPTPIIFELHKLVITKLVPSHPEIRKGLWNQVVCKSTTEQVQYVWGPLAFISFNCVTY